MGAKDDPEEFKNQIAEHILSNYDASWTLEAETKKGFRPAGVLFGIFAGPLIMVGDAHWFPWASDRNKIETLTNFFNEMRKSVVILGYSTLDDKKFFEHIAKHGIIRRVGTIHDMFDEPVALFQTRK